MSEEEFEEYKRIMAQARKKALSPIHYRQKATGEVSLTCYVQCMQMVVFLNCN